MFKQDLYKDKVSIVTGGGTGIGKDIAIKMVELGSKVMIAGTREGKPIV